MTQAVFPPRSEDDWRNAVATAMKGASFDKLVSTTADDLTLGPIHVGRAGPRALRAEPGPWKALTRIDHRSADDFNAQAREDLDNGADGLAFVFAGSGAAYGFGLADASPESLRRAFDGVAFDAGHRFSLETGAGEQAQAFAAMVERSGAEPSVVDVAFGLDPLGRLARANAPEPRTLTDDAQALRGRGFSGPLAAADARPVHDAGGTPAQELAFALAAGLAYLRALENPREIEFRLAADADQFATLAKFRALRLLWSRVEEACGLTPAPIRLAASSAWRMMTTAEPYVNVMRTSLAAFSAGLGGADSVTLLPFTQALGLPDAFARRLARNTQLVELREARLGFVADPAAGAGGFETLTESLCKKAWSLFQEIESAGGLARALEAGFVQREIAAAAERLQRDAARAKSLLTGVSAHPHLDAERVAVLPEAPTPFALEGLTPLRLSEPFERLRERADGLQVFLAAIGSLADHSRRLGFARETFEAGGVRALAGAGANDAAGIAQEFAASGAAIACLCGTDESYANHGETFAAALKQAGASAVYLAGRPGEREWQGVDAFVFAGMDLVAGLDAALRRAGR